MTTPYENYYNPAKLIAAYQVASTAELPNVSGATLQTGALNLGDLAFVNGLLYECTVSTMGSASWRLVDAFANPTMNSGGGGGLVLGMFVAAADGSIIAQNFGDLDITVAAATHATGNNVFPLTGADVPTTMGANAQTLTANRFCTEAYQSSAGHITVNTVGPPSNLTFPAGQVAANALSGGAVGLSMAAYTPGSGQYDFTVTTAGAVSWVPWALLNSAPADLAIGWTAISGGFRVNAWVASTLAAADAAFSLGAIPLTIPVQPLAADSIVLVTVTQVAA